MCKCELATITVQQHIEKKNSGNKEYFCSYFECSTWNSLSLFTKISFENYENNEHFRENTKKLDFFKIFKLESTFTLGLWKRSFFHLSILHILIGHVRKALDSKDKTFRTGQPGQDIQDRTVSTGFRGQGSKDRTYWTRQTGQRNESMTTSTG
jgi:hypothetical protein